MSQQRCVWLGKVGSSLCAILSVSSVVGTIPIQAQTVVRNAPELTNTTNTLAKSLSDIAGVEETSLAVGADQVYLPPGAAKPPSGANLAQIAPAYAHITRRYGSVTAIAPATMTLLNSHLGQPNIYLNIPAREAFTLLAANLSSAQIEMLTGERGLGLADMTSDMQRGLFLALLPGNSLPYQLRNSPDPFQGTSEAAIVENPLQNGRIRVGMKLTMGVNSPGREIGGLVSAMRNPNDPPIYDVSNQDHFFHQDVVDGVTVRSVVANTLKPSQLNYSLPILQTPISLEDLKTVGDLVARIGAKTRLELYADRHFEPRLLTLVGMKRTVPAGDLLRALAVCVTGTYRRVGPAYVLTDDIAGVGTRRTQIAEFQSDADAQRQKFLAEAEAKLQQTQALWKRPLSSFGDPMAPSAQQMQKEEKDVMGAGAFRVMNLNFDQLTPTQQNALKVYSDAIAVRHPENAVDFERPVQMFAVPSVQLLVPGVNGPIDTGLGQWVSDNFHDMSRWRSRPARRTNLPNAEQADEHLPALSSLVTDIPHRALLADCRATADVDNTIAKMKRMGLNELWLVVFTKGVARVGGTPFPTLAPDAPDLMPHALKATQGSGIIVYPVIDVFEWGGVVPPGQVDLTITGETSSQYAQRVHKRNALIAAAQNNPLPEEPSLRVTASCFAPEVLTRLNSLAAALAQRPGVSGVIWRETDPEGYAEGEMLNAMSAASNGQLGYTENARLAFLRSHHADPIDIDSLRLRGRGFEQRANTNLPMLDDWVYAGSSGEIDSALSREWNLFRSQANLQALSGLYAATVPPDGQGQTRNGDAQGQAVRLPVGAPQTADRLPLVFVRERRTVYGTTWYGLWNGKATSLPTHHYDYEEQTQNGDFKHTPEEFQQARAQGKINLVRLPFAGDLDESALVKQWQKAFRDVAQTKKWDGFVLESTQP